MSNPNASKLVSLNVMINKQKSKVLFVEAKNDFVDALLSFLTLPLGRLVTILRNHFGEEIGSLGTLYSGLLNLDETYFCVGGAKQMLLNPQSSFRAECRRLRVDITENTRNRYFLCQNQQCVMADKDNISLYSDIATCQCGEPLNREIDVEECLDGGGFTADLPSFIITDDLCLAPMTAIIPSFALADADTQGAELQSLSLGINEIRDLLKLALTSPTPLTDLIIKETGMNSANPEHEILFRHIHKDGSNSRKIVLKVCLQKSTNKFLYAVASDEFVELLFSFLTVPLGGVEFLLGGKTGLKNVDNLYRSINGIDDKYFTSPEAKCRLINPKLPPGYVSMNMFLPLTEEVRPKLYWEWSRERNDCRFYTTNEGRYLVHSFKSNYHLYMKKQTMCIVTDDLTVTSLSLATSISILNGLGISLSDTKEMELHIGLEEALSILKASLSSKTAFTDGLIKPMLNKIHKLERKPKQEC